MREMYSSILKCLTQFFYHSKKAAKIAAVHCCAIHRYAPTAFHFINPEKDMNEICKKRLRF